MSKKEKFDGKSRPANKAYDEGWDRIFGRKKFNRLQQEQRDLDESYQQSKRNKKEHTNDE
jgi:hypothetical protein